MNNASCLHGNQNFCWWETSYQVCLHIYLYYKNLTSCNYIQHKDKQNKTTTQPKTQQQKLSRIEVTLSLSQLISMHNDSVSRKIMWHFRNCSVQSIRSHWCYSWVGCFLIIGTDFFASVWTLGMCHVVHSICIRMPCPAVVASMGCPLKTPVTCIFPDFKRGKVYSKSKGTSLICTPRETPFSATEELGITKWQGHS